MGKKRLWLRLSTLIACMGLLMVSLMPAAHAACAGSDVAGLSVCATVTTGGSGGTLDTGVDIPSPYVQDNAVIDIPTTSEVIGWADGSGTWDPSMAVAPPTQFTVWLDHGSLDGQPTPVVDVSYSATGVPPASHTIQLPAALPAGRTCVFYYGPALNKPTGCVAFVTT